VGAGSGGDRSSAVRRRISAKRSFGMATSAIWNDVAAVAHHLRADLDQLLLQARQRPILDRFRRCQSAQETAEIVGERMKLEPNWQRTSCTTAAST
jgi:2-phospho-L-lactate transferase/gluconeogenesis factor (CofD/UPF0052 family)